MANPFMNDTDLMPRDIDTALLLEKATVFDIGKAVAYTDGRKIYVNTEDNLNDILPAYDQRFLKWILWHEKMHIELCHHNRFYKYLNELDEADTVDEFHVTKDEVNIIMDILVHDSLSKMFPELVENALENLAQMRNRNSLSYTFKTHTLEEMLTEYAEHKKDESDDSSETEKGTGAGASSSEDETEEGKSKSKTKEISHGESGDGTSPDAEETEEESEQETDPGHHDETDWSKLDNLDDKEFLTKEEADNIDDAVARIRHTKIKLGKLTETINGLVTTTRTRNYTMPSLVHTGSNIIMKGSTPGRTQLYFIFDASGSMSEELDTFKDIMKKSVPQAMDLPCEWFAGYGAEIEPYEMNYHGNYYKGKFKDIIPVYASSGFCDDGDRTIELCWKAEQLGYSPIGVTDGGGSLDWSRDKLKQLKRTVLVGHTKYWLNECKKVNPTIQIIDI